jgi:hypothetical protein
LNNATDLLGRISGVLTANTRAVSVLGARAMVLGRFLEAVLPHLTLSQRAEVARSFRNGIEDAMAQTDDVALPAEYHSTLLEVTNAILAAVRQNPVPRQ